MMTYEKALEFGNELFISNKCLKMTFREQAFLDLALTAIEKQIPKKPIKHEFPLNSILYDCPTCGHTTCDKRRQPTDKQYCENCGQVLDWGIKLK